MLSGKNTQLNSNKYLQLDVTFLATLHLVYGSSDSTVSRSFPGSDSNSLGEKAATAVGKAFDESHEQK